MDDEYLDKSETTIKYTLSNTSISIEANPDDWTEILALGKRALNQLGKKIYSKYRDEIAESSHIVRPASDIEEEIKKALENVADHPRKVKWLF